MYKIIIEDQNLNESIFYKTDEEVDFFIEEYLGDSKDPDSLTIISTPLSAEEIEALENSHQSDWHANKNLIKVDFISSEGINSTSRNLYQTKLSLVTEDLKVGTYLIQWTYEVQGKHAGHSRVILNNTEELGYNFYTKSVLEYITISGFIEKESFSGINTINIDWRAEDSKYNKQTKKPKYSFQIRRARLMLWRIS